MTQEVNEQETQAEVKTYTQEEVDKLLQVESDKRVSEALKTSKGKWEAEYSEKLKEKQSEAEKLARMSESEKAKHEFEQERQAFLTQKAEFDKAQLEMQALKELSNKNLPTTFLPFVLSENADGIAENIHSLEEEWANAINKEVEERLKGRTPQVSSGGIKNDMSYKDFGALPAKERARLLELDPNLMDKLK